MTYSMSMRTRHTLTRTVSPGKPLRYGVHSIQNRRREMEDAHCAVLGQQHLGGLAGPSSARSSLPESPSVAAMLSPLPELSLGALSYFAVFDGHGGARASEFSGERLYALLAEDPQILQDDPVEALRRAFARTEEEWLELARKEELMDGTTAAVVLVDKSIGCCIIGNVGDSEILLGTYDETGQHYRPITQVHHCKRSPTEADRVVSVGGRVWRGRLGHPQINPQVLSISVSRAIGDLFFKDKKYTEGKESGLTADPYITCEAVAQPGVEEQFLLIGCDGLWDTVSYQQAAEYVFAQLAEGLDPQEISEGLVEIASDAGSSDNITVIVVVL